MKIINEQFEKILASDLQKRFSSLFSITKFPILLVDPNGLPISELIPCPTICKTCLHNKNCVCGNTTHYLLPPPSFSCSNAFKIVRFPIQIQKKTLGYVIGLQENSNSCKLNNLGFQKSIINNLEAKENSFDLHAQICRHIAESISWDLTYLINNMQELHTIHTIEKKQLENKISELENKNLSLLINPHFLFNTLNSIARIAYFEKSNTTETLIYCLADLLRYNLQQGDSLHLIETELKNVEKYLYIQKVRFSDRFKYHITIPEEIKRHRIPTMILQPIVENALIHGISSKREGGVIEITAIKKCEDITIFIKDNGNGFDKKNNSYLFLESKGIGLKATNKRLKKYFGKEYGLKVVKSNIKGSIVAIHISVNPCLG